jgi:hypothetical protein
MTDDDYLHEKPTGGERVPAQPLPKDLFKGYVRGGYELMDAVAEYIDNSFEQSLRGSRPQSVVISVNVGQDGLKTYIAIEDNAGGCRWEDAVLFIQPGKSGVDPTSQGISRFGMGGKVAGLSVADKVMVYSKAPASRGFFVTLDRSELLAKTDWDFVKFDIPPRALIKDGVTRVVLYGVDKSAHSGYPATYLARLGDKYGLLLSSNSPSIKVGGSAVVPSSPFAEILTDDEAPDGCGPRVTSQIRRFPLVDQRGLASPHDVAVKVTVGLLPERSVTGRAGGRIYCNRRQVVSYTELGLLEATAAEPRRAHPMSDQVWLRAIVEVTGPAELMPWTNRKDRLDASAPTYEFLHSELTTSYRSFLHDCVRPQKLRLKRDLGIREPDILIVLRESYRAKLGAHSLDPTTIRPRIKTSKAFQDARRPPMTVPPVPTRSPDTKVLSGEVETVKIRKAKEIVRSVSDQADVTDADLVRTMLSHFLSCKFASGSQDGSDESDS